MKARSPFAAIISLIVILVLTRIMTGATTPDLQLKQLIAHRGELNGKRVAVHGYLDVKELILDVGPNTDHRYAIAVDFGKASKAVKKKQRELKSGFVRIVGKFEDLGPGDVVGPIKGSSPVRILVLQPQGFRVSIEAE